MGQAKHRGTFEQRKAQAVARDKAIARKRAEGWQRRGLIMGRPSPGLAIALLMALAQSTSEAPEVHLARMQLKGR